MNLELRNFFDQQLETVLAAMPDQVHRLLDRVPMVVEDHPSERIQKQLGIRHRRQLCGLYTGIPLNSRSVEHSALLSDVIHLFREGVLSLATNQFGEIDEAELREQIRITILHELGHHHGLNEEELAEMGY